MQAIKEEKMEVTLGQLKERWGNVVWGMDPYKGGDVPLLKIAEEDFEALEVCFHSSLYTRYTSNSGDPMGVLVYIVSRRQGV